jgi:hypothetical protein
MRAPSDGAPGPTNRGREPWIFGYQPMDIYGVSNRIKWTPGGDESIRLTEISFWESEGPRRPSRRPAVDLI